MNCSELTDALILLLSGLQLLSIILVIKALDRIQRIQTLRNRVKPQHKKKRN